MSEADWGRVHQGFVFTPELHERLGNWVESHYREQIAPQDLRDPELAGEAMQALGELTRIMGLGQSFYPVQRA